jgi:1-acyl-sn-glycerol-3-phosphate acyltransferase
MEWLKLPFRALYTLYGFLLFLGISLVGVSIILYWYRFNRLYFHEKVIPLLRGMADFWLLFTGNKLVVEGLEHTDISKPVVIVGNHSSTLDMFTCMSGIPYPFRGLAKAELQHLPVIHIMFRTLSIFVDRSNAESRAEGLKRCRKILNEGTSIFIMPEGTRNRTQKPLLPFKEGAFRLAIETQTPVQPFVLLNCRLVYPMWSKLMLRPGKIILKFLPQVDVSELTFKDVAELKERIRKQMEDVILTEDKYYLKENEPF